MWTRKSPSEIATQDRIARFDPLPAILWALLVGALTLLADVGGGWYDGPRWMPPVSVSRALPHGAFVVVAVFLLIYIAQLVFGGWWLRSDHQALFCPRCHAVQPKKSGTHCSCGEQLELLRNWKWLPDDISAR